MWDKLFNFIECILNIFKKDEDHEWPKDSGPPYIGA